jgi:hypothetical protein
MPNLVSVFIQFFLFLGGIMVRKVLVLAMLSASCVSLAYCAEKRAAVDVHVYDGNSCSRNIRLKSVRIPSVYTEICHYAFSDCSNLQTVDFGTESSVTQINFQAFSGCPRLRHITIPKSVNVLDAYAFHGCSALSQVTFEQGSRLGTIGKAAFKGCHHLSSIVIPNSVTSLGECTFEDCQNLTIVTFEPGSNIQMIQQGTFRNCNKLSIVIPESVIEIKKHAFTTLASITLLSPKTAGEGLRFCTLEKIVLDFNVADVPQGDGVAFLHRTFGSQLSCRAQFKDGTTFASPSLGEWYIISDPCSEAS